MRRIPRSVLALVAVVVIAGGAFGLYWFQPWKLFTSTEVNEQTPVIVAGDAPATPSAPVTPPPSSVPTATLVASGELVTHEHETSGTVQLVRLADGGYQLILRDLDTSDGPDLRVWLTDQPVIEGSAGWGVFDDGEWVELGKLKGNKGTQVYDLPADVDPAGFTSVSIWCKRFSVSFGAAPLTAV